MTGILSGLNTVACPLELVSLFGNSSLKESLVIVTYKAGSVQTKWHNFPIRIAKKIFNVHLDLGNFFILDSLLITSPHFPDSRDKVILGSQTEPSKFPNVTAMRAVGTQKTAELVIDIYSNRGLYEATQKQPVAEDLFASLSIFPPAERVKIAD